MNHIAVGESFPSDRHHQKRLAEDTTRRKPTHLTALVPELVEVFRRIFRPSLNVLMTMKPDDHLQIVISATDQRTDTISHLVLR